MLMFSLSAVADTINIIVSGKAGGTFHTRSMLMHDTLVDMGYEVNLINAGNLSKAAQLFRTSKDPVIMPWIDSANVKENLQPTKSTFGVLEYTAPVVFCSTKYNQFEAPKIKIGHSASWPIDIFISLEESLGKAEVRATFAVGKGAIAGCYIQTGKLQRNCSLRVMRLDKVIFEGNLDSLKRSKDDVKEVNTGFECGVGCDKFSSWIEGDVIEAFKFVTKKRTLSQ